MDAIGLEITSKINENLRLFGKDEECKTTIEEIKECEEECKSSESQIEEIKECEEECKLSDESCQITEEQYIKLINQAYAVASLPLIQLLKRTVGIDYSKFLFNDNKVIKKTAEIEFRKPNEKKQFALYLDIVDKDYDLNYGKYGDIPETKEALVTQCLRLISMAQLLFTHIRDSNKELLEYHLVLDSNSTLYIDAFLDKRIGIRFEPRKYQELK
jgi:hypothetical protein